MPKVYTRTGDKGETGLIDGRRVSKAHPVIEALGAVDELNSFIGVALIYQKDGLLSVILKRIQSELFTVGAEINSGERKGVKRPAVNHAMTERLEREMESLLQKIPEQKSFILPGGSEGGAYLHLCRSVARRAERRIVSLGMAQPLNGEILIYMNRLGDFLHVAARYASWSLGAEEDHPRYDY